MRAAGRPAALGCAAARRVLASLALLLTACSGDPFGPPARVLTHGYRAAVTVTRSGASTRYELAARGSDRRRESAGGAAGPVLIWKGDAHKVYELDTAGRTFAEKPFTSLDDALPGHPLDPRFSDREEAKRRGVEEYHRESDAVFAGHACHIFRFDEKPGDEVSASTAYWSAPDLDGLVLRVVREGATKPDGTRDQDVSELTNVRVGADPSLFEVPKGYRPK
jgi:hypothetical protein